MRGQRCVSLLDDSLSHQTSALRHFASPDPRSRVTCGPSIVSDACLWVPAWSYSLVCLKIVCKCAVRTYRIWLVLPSKLRVMKCGTSHGRGMGIRFGISLNWPTIGEVTTCNTTVTFWPTLYESQVRHTYSATIRYLNFDNWPKHVWFSWLFCFRDSKTRGHKHKLVVQHSRVDARQHFFCNRVVSVWNSLPEYVVLSPTVGLFRSRLNRFNLDKFLFVKC